MTRGGEGRVGRGNAGAPNAGAPAANTRKYSAKNVWDIDDPFYSEPAGVSGRAPGSGGRIPPVVVVKVRARRLLRVPGGVEGRGVAESEAALVLVAVLLL